jgi:membrane-associated phospholipid phosphatase
MTVVGGLVAVSRNRPARIVLLAFGLLVAVSRVVVGAHWPVDVLAGATVGWLSGVASMRLVGDRAWMRNRTALVILSVALAGCAIALLFTRIDYPGAYPVQVGVAVLAVGSAAWLVLRPREPMTDA